MSNLWIDWIGLLNIANYSNCTSQEDCNSTCCLPYINQANVKAFECFPIELCSERLGSDCLFDGQCIQTCRLFGKCNQSKKCYIQYISPYINLLLWTGGTIFILLISSFVFCKLFISYKTLQEVVEYIRHAEERIKRIRYLLREEEIHPRIIMEITSMKIIDWCIQIILTPTTRISNW